jgi:hypothetical protein
MLEMIAAMSITFFLALTKSVFQASFESALVLLLLVGGLAVGNTASIVERVRQLSPFTPLKMGSVLAFSVVLFFSKTGDRREAFAVLPLIFALHFFVFSIARWVYGKSQSRKIDS